MNNTTNENKVKVCSVEGCNGKHRSKGYCIKHYAKFRKYGDANTVKQIQVRKNQYENCVLDDCNNNHYSKGYCRKHYESWRRYGDPNFTKVKNYKNQKCEINGCDNHAESKGYCGKHYARIKRHGSPDVVLCERDKHPKVCQNDDCYNKSSKKGYCEYHYWKTEDGKKLKKVISENRRFRKANAPINDLNQKDWLECLGRFKNSCAYCDDNGTNLEMEHITPLALKGSNTKSNIVPSCRRCNASKHSKTLDEWYPKQPFYNREREEKILKWMGYQINENKVQMQLF